jgi:hypothetical protein
MTDTCADCGCNVYGGHCTNCHEEVFIAQQYCELDEPVPESIAKKASSFSPSMTEKEFSNS